ncbi:LOW QUALITY PROTEIN: uncharacterized protein LOC119725128 [Patiria miniata]|uniref:Uncharacterized protein n=1 Tax=Patiria miniata TaxID=46514 RepID=A0A913ZMY9_PATMI|nr:LOW QUALITY PROTEIN: uncharacterized protein LOC119725128 [Patiria miniata]
MICWGNSFFVGLFAVLLSFAVVTLCAHTGDDQLQENDDTYYRLFGGTSPKEGVLQFHSTPNETWNTMCYSRSSGLVVYPDIWASVCKQLGYKVYCSSDSLGPAALGFTSQDGLAIADFPLRRARFSCPISDGAASGCSLVADMADHDDCTLDEAVWLECDSVLDFHLEYGFHGNTGMLLARCSNSTRWKAVCGNLWKLLEHEHQVACRHLGYSDAARSTAYVIPTWTLSTSFDILLDCVKCTGKEDSLVDCEIFQPSTDACSGFAGLDCSEDEERRLELRLVDSKYEASGIVVGRHHPSDKWGAICQQTWDDRDAQVACRHLGYVTSIVVNLVHRNTTSLGFNGTFLSGVGCYGHESDLSRCELASDRDVVCDQLAYVECIAETERFDIPAYLCGEINFCGFECNQGRRDTLRIFKQETCKCDSLCEYFEDCCYDYRSNCVMPQVEVDLGHYACVSVTRQVQMDDNYDNWGYALVSFCPKWWTDASTRQSCEKMADRDDVIGTLPIYDEEGAVYKNVFCAACHRVGPESLHPWPISVQYIDNGGNFQMFDWKFNVTVHGVPTGIYSVEPPPHITARSCPVNTIKSCLPEFKNTSLESACQQYFAPLEINAALYHNPHCAMCNGLSVSPTDTCRSLCPKCRNQENWDFCVVSCSPRQEAEPLPTVEALFNFAFGWKRERFMPDWRAVCPFLGRCRRVLCVSGRFTADGGCLLPGSAPPPVLPWFSLLDDSCTESINRSLDPDVLYWKAVPILANPTFDFDPHAEFSVSVITESPAALELNLSSLFENHKSILGRCNITEVNVYISEGAPLLADLESCANFTQVATDVFQDSQDANESSLEFLIFRSFKWSKQNSDFIRNVLVPTECLEVLTLGCQQIVLFPPDEFAFRDSSGSITHTARGKDFHPGEFVLMPHGQAAVCGPVQWTDPNEFAMGVVALVCSCASLVALTATFVTYCAFSELRNMPGLFIMNLVVALFVALFLAVMVWGLDFIGNACAVSASLVHLNWLAAFFWMAMLSYNAAKTFGGSNIAQRRSGPNYRKFLASVIIVWGGALLVVTICLILHYCNCTALTPIYSEIQPCMIADANARLFFFGVPVATSLLISGACFVSVIFSVRKARKDSKIIHQRGRAEEVLKEVKIYAKVNIKYEHNHTNRFIYFISGHIRFYNLTYRLRFLLGQRASHGICYFNNYMLHVCHTFRLKAPTKVRSSVIFFSQQLGVLIGVTWVLAFVFELFDHVVFSYINVTVNALQGFFIFVAFCLNQRVRALWRKKLLSLNSKRRGHQSSSNTPTGTHSTINDDKQSKQKPDVQETRL